MTGTTEALGGSAAVDDAARDVTRPFYVYAVLANSLFQRGVFVLFLQHRGFSAGQVALLQTLIYLVSGLAELPTGVIADRIGRRASIVIGQILIAGCLLGQGTFTDYWVFLALFVGQGVGMACVSGSDTALLYDLLVRRGATARYVKVKSRFTMLGTVTSGAAIILGGQLQRISWGAVYVGSASCLVLAVVVLMVRVPEIRGADAVDEQDGAEAHRDATAWRAMLRVATPALVTLVVVSGLMHATLTPFIIFTQKTLSDQGAGTALVSVVISAGFFVGGLVPLLSDQANRRVGYRVIVPVGLLALAAALGLSGLGLVWVTIAAFLVLVGIPEITAVLVDNVLNEAVPSRHRASLLSMISFVESALIGTGYLVLGVLMDGLGSSAGMATYAAVPLLACLLWLPVLLRGARVTTGTEKPADEKAS
ncbi:MFS transporter [Streptomyces collinus]|uniref:Major facilitator superfamily protein n=1 Tax=Streptomyces collinus (strain DSM 40733 / Tue 365) TaxID=1214242 RepID=S5UPR0_STRC3|nr:MFS transporter [Streptomyces collinus]AGS67786.1 major facilitator superfamily protein [Streptomyces collinus Tu 365]UJA06416.1 MFS transporter [Streptomyces collinus]UJA12414.1 MFS transporter [Streptomyces collinus]UJA12713.1 MFS transporter [Streptomyces collinus]UJA12723.1 MFS transporter [Streptomyces collinus]